jgi:UDP-hydrolysing UDP-N-acetyl-D-glucosamine 2-epimerase
MMKICIVITNRAPYGRLKSVMTHIKNSDLQLQIVVAGSMLLDKYGEGVKILENDGFVPDEKLFYKIEGDDLHLMSMSSGIFTFELANALYRLKPDLVLVHADRYEQLAVAIAARYSNIRLAHNQGGEISGSLDDDVRNAITQMAEIHFTASEQSRQRVIAMRQSDTHAYNVGCPSIDLIRGMDLDMPDFDLQGVGGKIDFSKPYLVVMFHPNTDEYGLGEWQTHQLMQAVKKTGMQTVWFWPNIDAGNDDISGYIRRQRELDDMGHMRFIKNLQPEQFYRLLKHCSCFVGNSSSGIREGSYMGIPYVCVGTRQNNREHCKNVAFTEYNTDEIYSTIHGMVGAKFGPDYTFGNGTAGEKIVEVLKNL